MIGPTESLPPRLTKKGKVLRAPKAPTLDDPVPTHWAAIPSTLAVIAGLIMENPAVAVVGLLCALTALILRSQAQTRQVLRQIRDGQSNPSGQSTPAD